MSEVSSTPSRELFPFDDKVAHFVLYGVMGAALGWGRWMAARPVSHWLLLALGWAYGAVDEWHQSFVPNRTPDPADFLTDVVGVAVGYGVFLLLARRFASSSSDEPQRA